jgi:TfoX/Sxy family transcriptional regulator of competence genes
MPRFEKPDPALVARFETVLGRVAGPEVAGPEVTRRPMFGHPCAWVGGNMATGLFAQQWWVRLAPERLEKLLASGGATTLSVMPGRAMQGYAVMPAAVVDDDRAVDAWVRDALAFTATMPPKEPKVRKPKGR